MNHFLGMFELDPFGNSLFSLGKFQYEEEPCCHEETITVKKQQLGLLEMCMQTEIQVLKVSLEKYYAF